MKKINYTCDICGEDINMTNRDIPLNGHLCTSCNQSFYRFIFQQINPNDNYAEREASVDLCDECYSELQRVITERRNK